jgi:4-amino-4-deoxychorismate mutase
MSTGAPRKQPGADVPLHGLEPFRLRLDELDDQIARLLGERFQVCREVALHKREHHIPMMQPDRVAEVRGRYLARGAEVSLPRDFTEELFELMISATCRLEDDLMEATQRLERCPQTSVAAVEDCEPPALEGQ